MSQKATYKIFYSSRDASGVMWCPDCRAVEPIVASTFNQPRGPGEYRPLHSSPHLPGSNILTEEEAEIIYTGQRAEWKDKNNKVGCVRLLNDIGSCEP
jgi:hypothetical protein